uniref:Uncharacterized protein n=1 Tax=Trichobilharzia regenti TaxID=157069 RepID=A0AA85IYX8_TRIRE|nr:unnamed protein product [Trichobilharzia regenti]
MQVVRHEKNVVLRRDNYSRNNFYPQHCNENVIFNTNYASSHTCEFAIKSCQLSLQIFW